MDERTINDLARFRALIAEKPWNFAKTAVNNPHYYSLKKHYTRDEFKFMVDFVKRYGKPERFGPRVYVCFYVDGWKYWHADESVRDLSIVGLINRCTTNKPNTLQDDELFSR